MDRSTHPQFVPNDTAGTRTDTAVLLVGTAHEHDIDQRDIASTTGGYWITDRLAALVFEEGDEADAEPETEPDTEPKGSNTSGNRAAKNDS